jgi:phosphoserine phosphatase RsbU/P
MIEGRGKIAHGSSGKPPRIWLVDDSPLQAQLAERAISSKYSVEIFDDGAALLEALASRAAPELLILDWHMPGLSGLDLCVFVRKTMDAGQLPILVLTATGPPDNLIEALEAGANDFVMKPFQEPELQARIAALLRSRELHWKLADAEQRLRVSFDCRSLRRHTQERPCGRGASRHASMV